MSTVRRRAVRLRRCLVAAASLAGLVALPAVVALSGGSLVRDGVLTPPPSTVGLPAGDAAEVSAPRSWWSTDWPPVGPDDAGEPVQALTVPGAEADVAPSGRPAAGAGAGGGAGSAADPLDPDLAHPRGAAPDGPTGGVVAESYDIGPPAVTRPAMRSTEGFDVAGGNAESGAGEVVTYTVEVEPAVGVDLLVATAAVEQALHDPRSWARDHLLRRVEDPAEADVRVVLATPTTVDRLCGEAGLRTEGAYSCWNGTFAALNSRRWQDGADDFSDLTTYRRYLINHEFGHGLGHDHRDCPAPGALAPVMMQQTITTAACDANGWPYPDTSLD